MKTWEVVIRFRSLNLFKTGESEVFWNWRDRIIAILAAVEPPPVEFHCSGYDQNGGYGEVKFLVKGSTQFEACGQMKLLVNRLREDPLKEIMCITQQHGPFPRGDK